MSDQLILRYSISKSLFRALIISFIPIVFGGTAYSAFDEGDIYVGFLTGAIAVIFIILIGLIVARSLHNRAAQVIIDKTGIRLCRSQRLISWTDIEEVTFGEFRIKTSSVQYLGLKLKHTSDHYREPSTLDKIAQEINSVFPIVRISESDEVLFRVPISDYNLGQEEVRQYIVRLKSFYQVPVAIR